MGSKYQQERDVFQLYKKLLRRQKQLCLEMTTCIEHFLCIYDQAIHGNRFFGGALGEYLFGCSCRAVGIPVRNRGGEGLPFDLSMLAASRCRGVLLDAASGEAELRFGVKSSFKRSNPSEIRMTNKQGARVPTWTHPHIFIRSGIGIGYADPELLPDVIPAGHNADALKLKFRDLQQLWADHPEWLIDYVDIPRMPVSRSKRDAGAEMVAQVLTDAKCFRLAKHMEYGEHDKKAA